MCISDWSSDVCSSDPGRFLDLPADANLAGFGRAFAEIFERPRPVDRLAVDLEPLAHALEHRRDFRRVGAVGLWADVAQQIDVRMAARRVGKEWFRKCRYRGWPGH